MENNITLELKWGLCVWSFYNNANNSIKYSRYYCESFKSYSYLRQIYLSKLIGVDMERIHANKVIQHSKVVVIYYLKLEALYRYHVEWTTKGLLVENIIWQISITKSKIILMCIYLSFLYLSLCKCIPSCFYFFPYIKHFLMKMNDSLWMLWKVSEDVITFLTDDYKTILCLFFKLLFLFIVNPAQNKANFLKELSAQFSVHQRDDLSGKCSK